MRKGSLFNYIYEYKPHAYQEILAKADMLIHREEAERVKDNQFRSYAEAHRSDRRKNEKDDHSPRPNHEGLQRYAPRRPVSQVEMARQA